MTNSKKINLNDTLVRQATLADAEIIAEFNRAMAFETESHGLDKETVKNGVEAVFSQAGLGFYLIAERRSETAGCLMVTKEWSDWRNGHYWWIQSVYVDQQHRGNGLYRKMYDEVIKRAQLEGNVSEVRLYVEKDNTVAQAVYEKLGMENSGYLVYGVTL
jgi:ribosomal protein S18 acetylase RimI-like enzyme